MSWTAAAETRARAHPPEVDESTLGRASEGDESACRSLVLRYQQPVYALMCRMLGWRADDASVEDLTQEAFLRAFRSLARFQNRDGVRFSSWLLTIAARTAIDHLRRRGLVAEPLEDVEVVDPSASELDERTSIAWAIESAVDALGVETRAAFVLRAYHDLEYAEIASALGIDVGTVKSRLWRARKILQSKLQEVHDG